MLTDDKTRQPGVRVRRGLGTDSEADAQEIVDQINVMLGNQDYWKIGARDLASRQFKPKAVSAFYDHDRLLTAIVDPWEKRNVLPLPLETHSIVQIVGPYGVSKTTLIRQVLGTDPDTERFPSTSKGRCTICDTEIICSPGTYSAVVSFLSHDRVLAYIEECVEAAAQDKQNHVLISLEQAVAALDETIDGPGGASRRVRKHLANHVFFVGHIQEEIDMEAKSTKGTRKALNSLVQFLVRSRLPEIPSDAMPCYDLAYLFPGIHKATDTFQKEMNSLLETEHWKKVEALTRRFARQWEDGYKQLQPVARLRELLLDKLNAFFANPKAWKNDNCTQEAKEAAAQKITREFSTQLEKYISRRFREDELNAWRLAYARSGRGSGRSRSSDVRLIDEDVAPVPGEQKTSKLFDDIRQLCHEAIEAGGGEVIGGMPGTNKH